MTRAKAVRRGVGLGATLGLATVSAIGAQSSVTIYNDGRVLVRSTLLVHRELPLPPEPAAERLAFDVRHGEPEPLPAPAAFGGPGSHRAAVQHGEDVRVLQPRGREDLSLEPLGAERRGELGVQHLERDRPVVLEVPGQEDRGHPAPAQLALDRVAAAQAVL